MLSKVLQYASVHHENDWRVRGGAVKRKVKISGGREQPASPRRQEIVAFCGSTVTPDALGRVVLRHVGPGSSKRESRGAVSRPMAPILKLFFDTFHARGGEHFYVCFEKLLFRSLGDFCEPWAANAEPKVVSK